ncbi:putative pentatricopeptide repeat-containing protein At1g68930 [Setaria viridis]|uniref:putative pentatricopeptide repeat-containing protein At1g68930 n=1 Tax=Setaria viridis TaxID=4556 RepID=UPI001493AE06|nr:putative pentatricopeptide repeat-containing protein At1g68930 [Setaria viridis]
MVRQLTPGGSTTCRSGSIASRYLPTVTCFSRRLRCRDRDGAFAMLPPIRSPGHWTALVCGYPQFGKAKETIDLFEKMLSKGVKPDGVTFIGVFSACSRAGFVEKGRGYFYSMQKDNGIVPVDDHYTCMIDLYSRSGRLKEAEEFIKQMPVCPDAIGWGTLLSACRLRGDMEISKWAAEIDPRNPASYLFLWSMHAAKGQWNEVPQLRRGMKEPGCSWIKYKNKVHIFSADDRSH